MRNFLMILSLSLASFATASAQDQQAMTAPASENTIETAPQSCFKGTISDVENYKPIANAQVLVLSTDHQVEKTLKTDAKGRFNFENLPSGVYQVKLSCDGYEPYTRKQVVIKDGKPLNLGFILFKG